MLRITPFYAENWGFRTEKSRNEEQTTRRFSPLTPPFFTTIAADELSVEVTMSDLNLLRYYARL
ncbi:hypothetical protein CGT86_17530, partial [Vibrio cholerae]